MKALLLPLLAVVGLCGFRPVLPDPAGPVLLEVIDRQSGAPLQSWRDGRQRWVAGERGQPYALRLRNQGSTRVLVVLSVDGVNVINGQPASPDQTGYVLAPGQTTDITGWRKSDTDVARFVFSTPRDSYAARTGQGGNLGVIGMAVIAEVPPPVAIAERIASPAPPAPASARTGAAAETRDAASARHSLRREQATLGTGHGERETSRVRHTTFERQPGPPLQVVQLRYDSLRTLVERGIAPRSALVADGPRAFPGWSGHAGYVPDPPRR